MSIAILMHQDHGRCDDLFVAAEAACHARNWDGARTSVTAFVRRTETHFRTEEEVLFPAFEQATGSAAGPTQVMRIEHAQMRDLFAQMLAAIETRDLEVVAGAAETLLVLMQQHNMKEENILYPMCDQALPADQIAVALKERLEGVCPT